MKHSLKVTEGQSVLDLCVQLYGSTNYLEAFCRENGLKPTANVYAGDVVVCDAGLLSDWHEKTVCTLHKSSERSLGIGFMRLGVDFKTNKKELC
jgi:hypothetical protein